ncbi:MAG: AtpZ/AtpI family protein [Sphingobacteriaceae bacterium]
MQEEEQNSNKPFKKRRGLLNSYAQYSAIGFQMFVIIGAFAYAGYKIDENRQAKTPLATAFFSLIGVFIGLYLVIRTIRKIKS